MSTAKAVFVESISGRQLRGLPSKENRSTARIERIKELAAHLLQEAESFDHEQALAEASAEVDDLSVESGIDFVEAVRRFEMRLISRALKLTSGNQARAARMLGLGTTTLNYKVKQYKLV